MNLEILNFRYGHWPGAARVILARLGIRAGADCYGNGHFRHHGEGANAHESRRVVRHEGGRDDGHGRGSKNDDVRRD